MSCALGANAAVEGPGRTQFIRAAPAQGTLQIDGKLDEKAWEQAPVFSEFVQRFPKAGTAPSERTELRVLFDSETVYFGIVAHDSKPELIDRRMGRRDTSFSTDTVQVIIDSLHDHRTAYAFTLSAGSVQRDGLFFDDRNYTTDWDGVWDGVAGSVPDGWVAEIAIPVKLLRFPAVPEQTWGFSVRRTIAHLHEQLESVDNPPTTDATVSRLGHLTGLTGMKPHQTLSLSPYLASRAVRRPQFSDGSATPHLLEPSLDLGLDMRMALTSDLNLTATVNPDFGQVEADQIILNLTTFESFFPEKRPFFTEGLEFFQALGSETGQVPQSLVYSRRIGLSSPIFAAAKMTGTVAKGVEVAVLDALVAGPWQPQDEANPDGRWGLYPTRPLHLGPNSTLPGSPQPTTNYLAAVARGLVGANSRVGGTVAAALPLVGECTPELAAMPVLPEECVGRGGMAGAVDFDLRTDNSEYKLLGQIDASKGLGGLPQRTLLDGTVFNRGAAGYGGYLRAGKFGGEGFRWDVAYDFATPTLDLNATGFQRTQNEHAPRASVHYYRPNGLGPFKAFNARLSAGTRWTTDGRNLNRGSWMESALDLTLPSFDVLSLAATLEAGGYDVRQLGGTGVPLEQAGNAALYFIVSTNSNRPLSLDSYSSVAYFDRGPLLPGAWGGSETASLSWRPLPSLETGLDFLVGRDEYAPRYAGSFDTYDFLLANLQATYLSLTLRQQWLIHPRLSLQGYAQLFTDYILFGSTYQGVSSPAREPIRFSALTPVSVPLDNIYEAALNLSVVLRWEYRSGSTLFLVYSHQQGSQPSLPGEPVPATLWPQRLLTGPAIDSVLFKLSYYWSS
jgi:hypothetical protein